MTHLPAQPWQMSCSPALVSSLHSPLEAEPELSWGVQQVNFAIQNGCKLSRATVHKFKHNDPADLERVLQQVARQHRAARCAFSGSRV